MEQSKQGAGQSSDPASANAPPQPTQDKKKKTNTADKKSAQGDKGLSGLDLLSSAASAVRRVPFNAAPLYAHTREVSPQLLSSLTWDLGDPPPGHETAIELTFFTPSQQAFLQNVCRGKNPRYPAEITFRFHPGSATYTLNGSFRKGKNTGEKARCQGGVALGRDYLNELYAVTDHGVLEPVRYFVWAEMKRRQTTMWHRLANTAYNALVSEKDNVKPIDRITMRDMLHFPGLRDAWRSGYVTMEHSSCYFLTVPFAFQQVDVTLSYKGKWMVLDTCVVSGGYKKKKTQKNPASEAQKGASSSASSSSSSSAPTTATPAAGPTLVAPTPVNPVAVPVPSSAPPVPSAFAPTVASTASSAVVSAPLSAAVPVGAGPTPAGVTVTHPAPSLQSSNNKRQKLNGHSHSAAASPPSVPPTSVPIGHTQA